MAAALDLARRGLGRSWPNPAVGCVIVRDGRVAGRGWTQPGGRPHAETEAIRRAGDSARGATAYVSFEPCAHHGETPPCAEALIGAGLARVVVACPDPDPRVSGRGLEILKAAGIDVAENVLRDEAERLNRGFLTRLLEERPMVTLKVAASLDGRVATAAGHSKWITGPDARRLGHMLRADHDAIAVGSGTVKADNPSLTCRLPGMAGRSPVRVVLSSGGGIELASHLVESARLTPTWLIVAAAAAKKRRRGLEAAGVEVIEIEDGGNSKLDLRGALAALAGRGITRLLIEGGPRLATACLRTGVVDRVAWFTAPTILGGDALPAVADLAVDRLDDRFDLRLLDSMKVGADMLQVFEVVANGKAQG